VQKIINEVLANDNGMTFAKESRDLLIECCVEFITMISSEANEIAEKDAKKTIACEHITKALEELGFAEYVPDLLEVAQHFKTQQVVCQIQNAGTYSSCTPADTRCRAGKRSRARLSRAVFPKRSFCDNRKSSFARRLQSSTRALWSRDSWRIAGCIRIRRSGADFGRYPGILTILCAK